jgi:hypothetical protein
MSKGVNTGHEWRKRGRHRAHKIRLDKSVSTTDHETIKKWVEERGGIPVAVKGLCDEISMLRIEFPETESKDPIRPMSWEEFFTHFEQNDLEFLYQEKTPDGRQSRFGRFVSRIS